MLTWEKAVKEYKQKQAGSNTASAPTSGMLTWEQAMNERKQYDSDGYKRLGQQRTQQRQSEMNRLIPKTSSGGITRIQTTPKDLQNQWLKKYQGKGYNSLVSSLRDMEDGDEKDWLTSYADRVKKNEWNALVATKPSDWIQSSDMGLKAYEQDRNDAIYDSQLQNWLNQMAEVPLAEATPLFYNTMQQYRQDTSYKEMNDRWSEEQRRDFGYLYAQDKKKAEEYAIALNEQLNAQAKAQQRQAVQEKANSGFLAGLKETGKAIGAGMLGIGEYMSDVAEYTARGRITEKGDRLSPVEYSNAVTGGIAEHLNEKYGTIDDDVFILGGKGLGDVYSLGTSVAQSMASGHLLGGTGTLLAFFGNAAASGIDDAKRRGATDEQAIALGTLQGVAEGIAEKIGVDNLFKRGAANTIRGFLKNAFAQAGSEGIEEGLTSLFNNISENIVMGENSMFYDRVNGYMENGMESGAAKKQAWLDCVEDILFDSIAGAASGGVSGGIETGIQNVVNPVENATTEKPAAVGDKMSATEAVAKNATTPVGVSKMETVQVKPDMDSFAQQFGTQAEAVKRNYLEGQDLQEYEVGFQTAYAMGLEGGKADALTKVPYLSQSQREIAFSMGRDAATAQKAAEPKKAAVTAKMTTEEGTQDVTIAEVVDMDDTTMTFQLEDGRTVTDNDLEFEKGQKLMAAAWELGMDVKTVNTIVTESAANTAADADQAAGIQQAHHYGQYGYTMEQLTKHGTDAAALTDGQRKAAWEAGRQIYLQKAAEPAPALKASKTSGVWFDNGGGDVIAFDDYDVSGLSKAAVAGARAAKVLQKLGIGRNYYFFESYKNKAGDRVYRDENGVEKKAPNGWYDPDGSIHIDLNAGANGNGLTLYTLSHELTHSIEKQDKQAYRRLAEFLVANYAKYGDVDAMVAEKKAELQENRGEEVSYEEAYSEFIADSMEAMLADGNVLEKLQELKKTDKSLFDKIKEFFDNLARKIRSAYKDLKPDSWEGQAVLQMKDQIDQIQQLFAEALAEASENLQAASDNDPAVAGQDMSNEEAFLHSETAVHYQIRPPYADGSKAFNAFVEDLNPEARKTFDLFYGFYQRSRITNTVSVSGKKVKAVNISSLYLLAQDWNDMIAKEPKWAAAAKELADFLPADVRKRMNMNEDGTLIPTTMEKEFKMPSSMAQRLVDALPYESIDARYTMGDKTVTLPEGKARQSVGGEAYRRAIIAETRRLFAEGKLKPVSIGTMSKDRWGSLGFLAANGKTGASGDFTTVCPQMMFNRGCWYCYRRAAMEKGVNNKLVANNVWYTGEILRIKDSDIDALNRNGGLRIQSFGDWMPHFSAMLADVLYDAEQRGLQVKIITKEPSMISYIAALRNQDVGKNLYFNLSSDYTIERGPARQAQGGDSLDAVNPERPFMRDQDNSFWWKRAMSVEEAAKYREKYPWVNSRIVATDVEEFIRGLKDSRVDVVTGYHGNIRGIERIDSSTGQRKIEVEALGDAGMPRFAFNPVTGTWVTEYEGKTATHKRLAQAIADNGLQMEYYTKTCCITGRCATCNGKCGALARDFNVKNATNRDAESIAYWQEQMEYAEEPEFGDMTVDSGNRMYSDRQNQDRSAGTSNRDLLAGAFEDLARSPAEMEFLQKYQENIGLLNEQEQKLQEIRTEIRELTFGKGPKDPKRLEQLQEEAGKTANQIHIYDKELLQLEAAKPLRDVLDREREKVRKATRQKGQEAMAEYREKRKESAARKDAKRKIRKTVMELDKLLNRGDKKKNVKAGMTSMVDSVLKLADALFMDEYSNRDMLRNGVGVELTDAEEKAFKEAQDLLQQTENASFLETMTFDSEEAALNHLKKLEQKLGSKMSALKDVFARERKRLYGTKVSELIGKLAEEYNSLSDAEDGAVRAAKDENVYAHLLQLQKDVKDVTVRDMSLAQLEMVADAYTMVLTTVRNANKLFGKNQKFTVETMTREVAAQMRSNGIDTTDPRKNLKDVVTRLNEFSWQNLRPVDAFRRLGSEKMMDLFWGLVDGMAERGKMVREIRDVLVKARKENHYKDFDFKKADTYTTVDGKKMRLTLGEKMSIYAYSKREAAFDHMTEGGFTYAKAQSYKDDKGVTRYHNNAGGTWRLSLEDLENICNSLAAEQKRYADTMQKFLTEFGQRGNTVSRALFGIDLFKEQNYFPLMSNHDYLNSVQTDLGATQTAASLKNSGFTKSTTPGANNPIVLKNFDDVCLEHLDKMMNYIALTLPLENLRKVYDNVSSASENTEPQSTKALIGAVYGKSAQKYFDQFLKDANGTRAMTGAKNPIASLFSKSKAAAVSANVSVMIQQISAVVRASAEISPVHLVAAKSYGKGTTRGKQSYEEMMTYSGIANIKDMGGYDVGSSTGLKDYLVMEEAPRSREKFWDIAQDAFGFGAEFMDKVGWTMIWNAVKREVASRKQYTVNSAEFFQACADRFEEVVVKTQVFDSVLSRSGYMRSDNDSVKYLTSFMGEPTVTAGMVFNSHLEVIRAVKNRKSVGYHVGKLVRTDATLIVTLLLNGVLKALPYAARDDDEDESYWERWARHFGDSLRGDMNPLNLLPVARDISSIFEGRTIDRPDMALLSDLIAIGEKAVKILMDEDAREELEAKDYWQLAEDVLGAIGNLAGVPIQNIWRDIESYIRVAKDIQDDIKTVELRESLERGLRGEKKTKLEGIYDAMVSGDTARLEALKDTYKTEGSYESAVRKALRKYDPRIKEMANARYEYDYDRLEKLSYEIESEGIFDMATIRAAYESERTAQAKERGITLEEDAPAERDKESTVLSMEEYYSAIRNGNEKSVKKAYDALFREKKNEYYLDTEAEDSIESSVVSKVRGEYLDDDISRENAIDIMIKYGGKSLNEAQTEVKKWEFQLEYNYAWGSRDRCYRSGTITRSQLVSAVMDIEGASRAEAQEYVDFLDLEMQNQNVDITAAEAGSYFEHAKPYGISVKTYLDYKERTKGIENDKDANGKAIAYTAVQKIMTVINSLPISSDQKDALARSNGWADKTIQKYKLW